MKAITTASSLRITGQGGAALFMDACVLPGGSGGLRLGLDVSILSPDRLVTYLARAVPDDFGERLGTHLRAASVADEGDSSAFEESEAGLLITITPVDGMWVEMEVRIAEVLNDDVVEFDGINFETSRASLLVAAESAEQLSWTSEIEGE